VVLQRDGDRGQAVVAFTRADVAYLASAEGAEALAEVAGYSLTDASSLADIAAARRRFNDRAAILIDTVLLRRRAAAKLKNAQDWLFSAEALQQATATEVAAHRARRLAGRAVHDVTCSVGAELAQLAAHTGTLIGSDLDPIRLAMAAHNLKDLKDLTLARADALRPVSRHTVVLADPARRTDGQRRFNPKSYQPPLDALLAVYRQRDYAVKAAPGIDFDWLRGVGFAGEIEVTSLAGDVREACLWSPGLSSAARTATVLRAGGGIERVTDADPDDSDVAEAGKWLVDPDGAVVRAGLVRQYATRHGLWQLDPNIAYLSGDELPPGVRGFAVIERIPFGEKRLRQALAALDCAAVEILVRGVNVDPAVLRPRLRLRGTQQLSVLITRIGAGAAARATAFICRPSQSAPG
jgi:hypothetical protein